MNHYPHRHLSIRVPWHQAAWNGTVCLQPGRNTACLKLKNIFQNKREKDESKVAGELLSKLEAVQFPPCVKERATFMAPFSFTREHEHPYSKKKTHQHFRPTTLAYPAYGAAALPFRWLMKKFVFGDKKDGIRGLIEDYPLTAVSQEFEPSDELLGFKTNWLQDHRNHRALLDCFWGHVRPGESLVFFYAKQVPLVEDTGRRVIVGVGRILDYGKLTEYAYDGTPGDKLRSLLWERMVSHSIRPGFADGFLMPYHDVLEKSDEGRAFDPADVVAFAPEDRFEEFSYATEHVNHDAAISGLLACRAGLLRAAEHASISIKTQEQWIDRELGKLWKKRGPFPGMGSVLSATGIAMGNFIAQTLSEKSGETGNPWRAWDEVVGDPKKHLPPELSRHIDNTVAKAWAKMSTARRRFLETLSRIDVTLEQASLLAIPEVRTENGIVASDGEFLGNPYLFYETTRLSATPVALGAVDRGFFPTNFIRQQFPVEEPSRIETAVDARRLRALVIRELEVAATRGDTLRPRDDIITALRSRTDDDKEERTLVTADLLAVAETDVFPDHVRVEVRPGNRADYQLERFHAVGEKIRTMVQKRTKAPRHKIQAVWRTELDGYLEEERKRQNLPVGTDEYEERARCEKAAALAELAAARFSVLIGPAGTGKTTLLSVLCRHTEINQGGILLLAPTGKARVRMEAVAKRTGSTNFRAHTLAQFLCPREGTKRYDPTTGRYFLTGEPGDQAPKTVIVDECSMLTEEMMAALLEALSAVDRIIFVGDSRQLPPIGAGRPFVDILAFVKPENLETTFPRVAPSFAELTVPRRQGSAERDDLQLAAWFGGGGTGPGDDEVFEILAGRKQSDYIRFFRWETPDELDALLPKVLAETLQFAPDKAEWQAFAASLGAVLDDGGSAWFNNEYGNRPGAGKQAEAWQILSPVRQQPWGVDVLNRAIHLRYKGQQVDQARNPGRFRNIPPPMGEAQIIYGDKVINVRNGFVPKFRIYPSPDTPGYLANGEIGMVVGHRRTRAKNWEPEAIEVEYSTQSGRVFKLWKSDFNEERDAGLELAYALTVHKAQGSEFDVVFLVLPRSPLMLTRELLYTALTRQKKKIVVLHQGAATDLQKLSSERYSAAAVRLTNLFGPPKPVKIGEQFLEERLIHSTARGESVRSKSEVIIANMLHAENVPYHYERPLELGGVTKYPDFTIPDDDSGVTYFWEHCGMLGDKGYAERWKQKEAWYRENQILPIESGGGAGGTLVVSRDSPNGGIDSKAIAAAIALIKGR